jgi:hypothetical protein
MKYVRMLVLAVVVSSCGDGIVEPKPPPPPPPEQIQVSYSCTGLVNSAVLELASGGAKVTCQASVQSTIKGDVTSLSGVNWSVDGAPAGDGREREVFIPLERPQLTSVRVCAMAKLGALEAQHCQNLVVHPRQRGYLTVADSSATEPLVGSLILRSSQQAVDTAVVGVDMHFYFPGSVALAFGYEFVPARPSYHRAKMREAVPVVSGREVEVLAIPYSFCLIRGKFNGKCSNIELAWVHKRSPPPHPETEWASYYHTNPTNGEPAYYGAVPLPIRVGFKRGDGYLPITPQDSAFRLERA